MDDGEPALAEYYGGSIEDLGLKGFGGGHGIWKQRGGLIGCQFHLT
jgi:hypothetical protein